MPDKRSGAGWLGRSAVARALGVSVSTVRRLEGTLLHPVHAAGGARRFDPDEVERARAHLGVAVAAVDTGFDARDDGDLAARLFPLFERGASFADVIGTTRASPESVRALYWEWRQGYRRPAPAPTAARPRAGKSDRDPDVGEADDDSTFAEWEREVRALDREQARIERLARPHRRH